MRESESAGVSCHLITPTDNQLQQRRARLNAAQKSPLPFRRARRSLPGGVEGRLLIPTTSYVQQCLTPCLQERAK